MESISTPQLSMPLMPIEHIQVFRCMPFVVVLWATREHVFITMTPCSHCFPCP